MYIYTHTYIYKGRNFVPQKIFQLLKNLNAQSRNSTSIHVTREIEEQILTRYLYLHVHSNFIHNSQKVGKTQMSTDMNV